MKHILITCLALLPLLASPITAQADEADKHVNKHKGGTISVNGTGSINLPPDMARVSAGVMSRAKTAQAALADNNTKMTALIDELKKAGIKAKDIQTNNFNIHPDIIYPKRETRKPPQIVGYSVNNQVSVKIRELKKVGPVLTALVNAGANNMSDLSFDISNRKDRLAEARKKAITDARAKADLYAAEAGSKIKRMISLSEGGGSFNPRPVMMARSAKMEMVSSDVPVAEGSMSLSITVHTQWELVD